MLGGKQLNQTCAPISRSANEIVTQGDADLVFLARELLREPYWALKAQQELGSEPSWPISYGYAVKRQVQ
jgi:2,4-dienoyl-CoA reductase-like NADH-dependent reductase (Old Yellow Enzyme family)